ncbi:MAG: hypothetical protein Q9196_004263 [Gyalolechia fulgens]
MVGLFSCIFVKATQRSRISNVHATEIKRGMGGLHGNKSSAFPSYHNATTSSTSFIGGGDGSMILDHEICILNGDLNYRIDTMSRDIVIKAIQSGNLAKLLERDQLLVSRRKNPTFGLKAFTELPIQFDPTYKYDIGSNIYDSSEKHRTPAWCDRILYRGPGKIKQLQYRRHELRASDHRPVSGDFIIRVKTILPDKRDKVWEECQQRFQSAKSRLVREIKFVILRRTMHMLTRKFSRIQYLRDVLGLSVEEARDLIQTQPS